MAKAMVGATRAATGNPRSGPNGAIVALLLASAIVAGAAVASWHFLTSERPPADTAAASDEESETRALSSAPATLPP